VAIFTVSSGAVKCIDIGAEVNCCYFKHTCWLRVNESRGKKFGPVFELNANIDCIQESPFALLSTHFK